MCTCVSRCQKKVGCFVFVAFCFVFTIICNRREGRRVLQKEISLRHRVKANLNCIFYIARILLVDCFPNSMRNLECMAVKFITYHL